MLFKKTAYTDGLVNLMINWFGGPSVDFIDGPYWAKLFVLCFYTVFTPVSTLLGNYFTAKFADVGAIDYIVLGCTMATNMITEFLYDKFVVFRNQENTAT